MRTRLSGLSALRSAVAVVLTGALVGACGSASPATGAGSGAGGTSTAALHAQAIKFSQCMRANGVPDFPDPGSQGLQMQSKGNGTSNSISVDGVQLNVSAPAFQAAQKKCQKEAPQGPPTTPARLAQARANALAMAKCMRAHGVKDFPDPQVTTGPGGHGIAVKIGVQAAGGANSVNPRSPAFQAAQKACMPLMRIGAKAK